MEDSLRLKILKALTAALKTIGTDEGPAAWYDQDMSEKVFRGRVAFGSNDPIPLISILEAPLPVDRPAQRPSKAKTLDIAPWDLLVQGWVQDDIDNPTDPAYYLANAVQNVLNFALSEKLTKDDPIFGQEKISQISIGRPVIRPPDEISSKAYFWIGLSFVIVEDGLDGASAMP